MPPSGTFVSVPDVSCQLPDGLIIHIGPKIVRTRDTLAPVPKWCRGVCRLRHQGMLTPRQFGPYGETVRNVRLDSSVPWSEVSFGHFDTCGEMSRHFRPTWTVPKFLSADLSWVRSVRLLPDIWPTQWVTLSFAETRVFNFSLRQRSPVSDWSLDFVLSER